MAARIIGFTSFSPLSRSEYCLRCNLVESLFNVPKKRVESVLEITHFSVELTSLINIGREYADWVAPISKCKIENIVATTSLNIKLDLSALAISLAGAAYESEQFPGLIYRLKDPKATILLFHSGKVVCTGAKSLEQVKMAIEKVTKQLEELGVCIETEPKIEVQNIVSSVDLGQNINLNAIAITLGMERVEYEPEQFAGLIYRMDAPKVLLLIFRSGKIVCAGARKSQDNEDAVEKITMELRSGGQLR